MKLLRLVESLSCLALLARQSLASTASSSSSSFTRPPFVQHVTPETLQKALVVAQERHHEAVQQALANYPTTRGDAKVDTQRLDAIQLREYQIQAPGQLADFGGILPRAVYVTDPTPLFTRQECDDVIAMAEDYFDQHHNGTWTRLPSGQYQVAGFWIRDVPAVHEWFVQTCRSRLFPLLARQFPHFCEHAQDLCVDNAYCFKYTPQTGRRTDVHVDSGCLSFTIALSDPNVDYTKGGTWFEGLLQSSQVLAMHEGQVTIRPGGVKHAAHAVESGTRYIIGGFCMHQHKMEPVRMLLTTQTKNRQELLEAAVALNPACDTSYNMLANQYESSGNPGKAQQVLEYCLRHVHPKSGEVAYALGSLYMAQEEYLEAKQCMDICLEADDGDVDAMTMAAQALSQLGDTTSEQAMYQRIVATPTASRQAQASALTNLGVLHQGTDSEMDYYQQALNLAPTSFTPRYSMACVYASRKDWKAAVQTFRQALDHADTEEHATQALQALYKATRFYLENEQGPPPSSQQEVMKRFQQVMGEENFARLAALSKRQ